MWCRPTKWNSGHWSPTVHGPSDALDLKLVSHPGRSIIIIIYWLGPFPGKNNGLENVNHVVKLIKYIGSTKRVNRISEVK